MGMANIVADWSSGNLVFKEKVSGDAILTLAADGLSTFNAGLALTTVARTATSGGLTTGTIASGPMLQVVVVTSANADYIIVLPAPTPGTIVILLVGSNGCELRTSDPATIGINGGTGATAESAIPADTTVLMICESATNWKGLQLSSAAGTLAKVEVAA